MNPNDFSLEELFRVEAKAQVALLTDGLIALGMRVTAEGLEELMRAAHSLKGAARIVGNDSAVEIAHELEECFVAAQEGRVALNDSHVDVLLHVVDALAAAAARDPDALVAPGEELERQQLLVTLREVITGTAPTIPGAPVDAPPAATRPAPSAPAPSAPAVEGGSAAPVIADAADRLLTLAGEALVASRVLLTHTDDSTRESSADRDVRRAVDVLRAALARDPAKNEQSLAFATLERLLASTSVHRRERAVALEAVGLRVFTGVTQLYDGVLDARMRPFGDGVAAMPRMVRDTARELGRDVQLVIRGETTPVDRELLRRLEAPLGHLVRNAVDHGIEPPAERTAAAKPARGTVVVEAHHAGGRLLVSVEDDGRGIVLEAVRQRVVARGLADAAAAEAMSDSELSHFLFLPGFTMRDTVTTISGRGVGLDAVQTTVREIGGDVRVLRAQSGSTRFELQLPLTLSVVRALVVEVGGESYAFPLARVHRILRVERDAFSSAQDHQHFALEDRQIGLVWAHQLLELPAAVGAGDGAAAVVVIGAHESAIGVVVDRFVGEHELVLRGLDARLGKLQDVGGAALLPDGSPVLVLDVEDLVRTAANMLAGGRLDAQRQQPTGHAALRKRVLVVDDSLTVRELERKMIEGHGYDVDVAVDGMDGWNAVRARQYDLVLTDVDMPRMDGIELVTLIKREAGLRAIPVMIVSYKDRDEDRRRGMDAGADYYLTKGSFYDETMLRAIDDFIGGER